MQYQSPSTGPSAFRVEVLSEGWESRGKHYIIIIIAATSFFVLNGRTGERAGGGRIIIWGCTVPWCSSGNIIPTVSEYLLL